MTDLVVRLMTASDRRYVASTWAASSGRIYDMPARHRSALIDAVLDSPMVRTLCLVTGNTVHAWACGNVDVVHWVYVPPELRGVGYAKRLWRELGEPMRITAPICAVDGMEYRPVLLALACVREAA